MKKRFLPFALLLFSLGWNYLQAQWTSLGSGVSAANHKVWGIEAVDENIIWAVSYNYQTFVKPEYLIKSNNGGNTWTTLQIDDTPASQYPLHIYPLGENLAWLATSDELNPISGRIYKTTDGGQSWVHQGTAFSGFNETPAGVYFWNENEGVAFGATHLTTGTNQISVYRTENGGALWTKVVAPNFPAQLAGEGLIIHNENGWFDVRGDYVWFQTNGSRIYRSADRGISWTAHVTGLNDVSGLAFKDSLNGIVVNYSPNAGARTSDGGLTWTPITSWPSTPATTEIAYVPGTKGTYVLHASTIGSTASVLVSYNDGSTWEILTTTPNLECLEFNSPTLVFAGGFITNATTGGIYKLSGPALGNRLFVNDDAAGANDGTSWADAFNDLQDALAIAQEGDQIWVAEGTYLPGSDPNATFLIDKNLQLYGGFVGTETSLAQRGNPADHPTILSGDLDDNDVPDDFVTNRADNVMTVMRMTAAVTNETVVDGFTISNGHADGSSLVNESGGGIYSNGAPVVKNCVFQQHFGKNYGGFTQAANSNKSTIVENCRFEKNRSRTGAGMSFQEASGTIQNCTFKENTAVEWAGGFASSVGNTSNSPLVELKDCTFENNQSGLGGGGVEISLYGNSTNTFHRISNCSFLNNASPNENGGAIHILAGDDCTSPGFVIAGSFFSGNTVLWNGTAIWADLEGQNTGFELKNSEFVQNMSETAYGAIAILGFADGTGTALVDSCTFDGNSALFTGGAGVGNGDNAKIDFTISNCTFNNNEGLEESGAIGIFCEGNSQTDVLIENCILDGNKGTSNGGGIQCWPDGDNINLTVSRTRITNNESDQGAAVDVHVFGSGSPFPDHAFVLFENCLIDNNSSQGAAVSLDSIGNTTFINCTIADNLSNGIQLSDQSTLTLQNTVLANPGHVEYTASTNSTVTSNGGNLVLDNSLNAVLTAMDKPGTAPDFMPSTYGPSATSPLVNAGVNAGVTATADLAGNDRIQQGIVDIGAYESPFLPTSVREIIVGEIGLVPNPATDLLFLELPAIAKPTRFDIFDAQGRLVQTGAFSESKNLQVGQLPGGVFTLKMTDGERVYVGRFVKQ